MLRCECQARLGRGWLFCEACGRPVTLVAAEPRAVNTLPPGAEVVTPEMVTPEPADTAVIERQFSDESGPAPTSASALKPPAVLIGCFDLRFLMLPLLTGALGGLLVVWLTPWALLAGIVFGGAVGLATLASHPLGSTRV